MLPRFLLALLYCLAPLLPCSAVAEPDSHSSALILPASTPCQPNRGDAAPVIDCLQQEQTHSAAAYQQGLFYYQRAQSPQDLERAYHWFSQAAEQGEANAQFQLGQMLYRGEGTEADGALALVMLQIAFINGHQQAIDMSDRIEGELSELQRDQALGLLSQLFLSYQQQLLASDRVQRPDSGSDSQAAPPSPGSRAPAIELNTDPRF